MAKMKTVNAGSRPAPKILFTAKEYLRSKGGVELCLTEEGDILIYNEYRNNWGYFYKGIGKGRFDVEDRDINKVWKEWQSLKGFRKSKKPIKRVDFKSTSPDSGSIERKEHDMNDTNFSSSADIRNVQVMQLDPLHFNVFFRFDGHTKRDQVGEALVRFHGPELNRYETTVDIYVVITRNGKQIRRKMKKGHQFIMMEHGCLDAVEAAR